MSHEPFAPGGSSLGKSRGATLAIAALLIVTAIFHLIYIAYDGRLVVDHDIGYTYDFGIIQENMQAEGSILPWFKYQFQPYDPYPLVNLFLAATGRLFGMSPELFRGINLLFYLSFILAAYALGSQLGDRKFALLCAFIAATAPMFDNFSRKYYIQFHATGFILWAQFAVLSILNGKTSTGRFVLLGTTLGLALLTHPVGLLMSLPIFLFLAYWAVAAPAENRNERIWNVSRVLLATAICGVIGYRFLTVMAGGMLTGPLVAQSPLPAILQGPDTLAGLLALAKALALRYTCSFRVFLGSPIFFALIVAGIGSLILRRGKKRTGSEIYFAFAVAFYLVLGIGLATIITLNGFPIIYILLPMLILSRARAVLALNQRRKIASIAAGLLILAIVAGGMIEKSAIFSETRPALPCSSIGSPNTGDRRYFSLESGWGYRVANSFSEMRRSDDLSIAMHLAERDHDRWRIIDLDRQDEKGGGLFSSLRFLGNVNGFSVRQAQDVSAPETIHVLLAGNTSYGNERVDLAWFSDLVSELNAERRWSQARWWFSDRGVYGSFSLPAMLFTVVWVEPSGSLSPAVAPHDHLAFAASMSFQATGSCRKP
jgi:4-amino-4-deoxy-L-arabinose transferase-like glycosyltransferase